MTEESSSMSELESDELSAPIALEYSGCGGPKSWGRGLEAVPRLPPRVRSDVATGVGTCGITSISLAQYGDRYMGCGGSSVLTAATGNNGFGFGFGFECIGVDMFEDRRK